MAITTSVLPSVHSFVHCRHAQEDIPAVQLLENRAHSHPWSDDTLQSLFASPFVRTWMLEDSSNRQALGFAVIQVVVDEASLLNIAIAPEQQGKGYGALLLQAVISEITSSHKLHSVFLEVRAGNKPALALYERCGFVETGLRKNYYPAANGKREDAVMMAMPLGL